MEKKRTPEQQFTPQCGPLLYPIRQSRRNRAAERWDEKRYTTAFSKRISLRNSFLYSCIKVRPTTHRSYTSTAVMSCSSTAK